MNLTIKERIFLRTTFKPEKLGLVNGDLWDDIEQSVKFTKEEVTKYNIVETPGDIKWNPEIKEDPVDFEFSAEQVLLLKRSVRELDRNEAIPNFKDVRELARKILKS